MSLVMPTDITQSPKFVLPTIFVVFGITGDLVKRKILRAMYHLYTKELLPKKFRIYGFARRELTDPQLREYLEGVMEEQMFPHKEQYDDFLASFYYIRGDFHEKEAYKQLASILGYADGSWNVCSNKLFYLAVPPVSYKDIIENLHESGLTVPCSPEEGWTRVILEKPFGTDLNTALELDLALGKLFKEEQIYRVDYYLAKDTVRNILAFRFSNTFLTPAWNKNYIEKIEIQLLEKDTVSTRGEFYDKVGTLRDVGQNHLLQLLALFIMDEPQSFTPDELKRRRSEALASIQTLTPQEVGEHTVRGQYEGYREEKGVHPRSQTETYFRIRATTTSHLFEGVPLYLEAGKAMKSNRTQVTITFKRNPTMFYDLKDAPQNVLEYHIRPDEKIVMKFLAKKPGFEHVLAPHDLGFDFRSAYTKNDFVDDYEALLYDIIKGDQTLFVSTKEIISEWQCIEPIVKVWENEIPPLHVYTKYEHNGHCFTP